jgi:hypothetical protein
MLPQQRPQQQAKQWMQPQQQQQQQQEAPWTVVVSLACWMTRQQWLALRGRRQSRPALRCCGC